MTVKELADLGKRMRDAQRAYFRTVRDDPKKFERLEASKGLERQFDAATHAILKPPTPTLFDMPMTPEEAA